MIMIPGRTIKSLCAFYLIIQLVRFTCGDDEYEDTNNNEFHNMVEDCSNTFDEENCKSNVIGNLLLYSTENEIKSRDFTTNQINTLVHRVNCTAFTAARDHVYYATVENIIFRASIYPNTTQKKKLIKSDSEITSIAVDYITGNIYYTSDGSLFVCDEKGQKCQVTNCCNIYFVALAPTFGCMFYVQSDNGLNTIVKANMDGSEVMQFYSYTEIPIPIAVNEQTKRVLFANTEGSIADTLVYRYFNDSLNETASYDNIEICMYNNPNLVKNPTFLVATIEDMLLYINWLNSIITMRKDLDYFGNSFWCDSTDFSEWPGQYFEDNSTGAIKLLYAYNPSWQNSVKRNRNPCAEASCPGLCLLHPSLEDAAPTYVCKGDKIYRWYGIDPEWIYGGMHQGPSYWSMVDIESRRKNTLLYSTESEIKFMELTTNRTHTFMSGVNCTALTAAHDHVYCATSENIILRISIHPNATQEELIKSDLTISSIAVDYITGNIHYTANGSLFVCGEKGQNCQVTNCCNITFVALAPTFGCMFYVQNEYGYSRIVQANMDGSDVMLFHSYAGTSIAVDEQAKRILLIDVRYDIEEYTLKYLKFDSSFNKPTFPSINICTYKYDQFPRSLAAIESMSIFTAGKNEVVVKRNSDSRHTYHSCDDRWLLGPYFKDNSTSDIKLLYAYNPSWQNSVRQNQSNPCTEASCPGLCLLRPSPENTTLTYACQGGQIYRYYNTSLPDSVAELMYGKPVYWSTPNNESYGNILLYSTESEIKFVDLTKNQTHILAHTINCTALTAAGEYVYYATSENIIFRTSINPNAAEKEELIKLASTVTSISADYITGNIYYTSDGSLFVCGEKGENCTETNCCDITFVALAPMFGCMFYIQYDKDAGHYHIVKVYMDGSGMLDVFPFYSYTSPPLAVVDEQAKRVLFPEAEVYRDRCTLVYMKFESDETLSSNYHKICSFGFLEDYGFDRDLPNSLASVDGLSLFTNGKNSKVYARRYGDSRLLVPCDLPELSGPYVEDNNATVIKLIYAYNPSWQNYAKRNRNPCAEASCPGLCSLRPSLEYADLTYACPGNQTYRWYPIPPFDEPLHDQETDPEILG